MNSEQDEFQAWYQDNEEYLVTQPLKSYIACAAWKHQQAKIDAQAAEIDLLKNSDGYWKEVHVKAKEVIDKQAAEIKALRFHIAYIASAMDTKAINNPDGVKASTLEALATELYSIIDNAN